MVKKEYGDQSLATEKRELGDPVPQDVPQDHGAGGGTSDMAGSEGEYTRGGADKERMTGVTPQMFTDP